MLFAQGRGVAIVVIVALAGLVALGAAEPRVFNDNSSQFYSSIIVNFFPFCGLEECAMHIDNPQMRGLSFAALLGMYAEGTTDCGYSADHRRGLNKRRGLIILSGLPEYYSG